MRWFFSAFGKNQSPEIDQQARAEAELLTKPQPDPVLLISGDDTEDPHLRYFHVRREINVDRQMIFDYPFEREKCDTAGASHEAIGMLNLVEQLFLLDGTLSVEVSRYAIGLYKGWAFDWEPLLDEICQVIAQFVYGVRIEQLQLRWQLTFADEDETAEGPDEGGGDVPATAKS